MSARYTILLVGYPAACREDAVGRCSDERMHEGYLALYSRLKHGAFAERREVG